MLRQSAIPLLVACGSTLLCDILWRRDTQRVTDQTTVSGIRYGKTVLYNYVRRGLKTVMGRTACAKLKSISLIKRPPSLCDDMIGGCDTRFTNSRLTYCRAKHSFCAKVSDTECKWILSKKAAFKKCIESWRIFSTTWPEKKLLSIY